MFYDAISPRLFPQGPLSLFLVPFFSPLYAASPTVNPMPWLSRELQWLPAPMLNALLQTELKFFHLVLILKGRALQWAEFIWNQGSPFTKLLDLCISHFHEVFGRPIGDITVSEICITDDNRMY